jgi:hypothetical protein
VNLNVKESFLDKLDGASAVLVNLSETSEAEKIANDGDARRSQKREEAANNAKNQPMATARRINKHI